MEHGKFKYWIVCKTCRGKCLKVGKYTKLSTILKFLFEKHLNHEITVEKYAKSGTILHIEVN